jgi:uncharacterized surface protein with fasciclin (FAS1) repeats
VPFTTALANQPNLSSFAAVLKFIGADDELTAATDADIIAFAPTNAALDAFAKQMIPSNPKATAKDLLNDKYYALLAHVAASHVAEDDDDDGVYNSFGGQKLLVSGDDDDDDNDKAAPPTVSVVGAPKNAAKILREEDLGSAGDIYVVDRVLTPSNVFPTMSAAVKADPELATFGRLVGALAPEIAKSADAGAPATVFAPSNGAFAKFLASAKLTEAQVLADAALKARVAATLAYHVSPGVGLDGASLAETQWTLPTALVVAPDGANAKAAPAKTLKVGPGKGGDVAVQADLSKATVVGGDIFAGADVVHKVDAVLVPEVKAAAAPTTKAAPVAAAVANRASSGRKLLRTAARNNIAANTQRANIRRAMNGSMSVSQATRANNVVGQLATMNRVPNYFLTQSGARGGFFAPV